MQTSNPCRELVLLGIGHTNAHVLQEWAQHPIPNCQLTCISPFETATYSGMLPGALGTQFSDAEMRIDLRRLSDAAGAKLIVGQANGIDLQAQKVIVSGAPSISYDALAIGIGSVPAGSNDYRGASILVPTKPMQTFLSRLETQADPWTPTADRPLRCSVVGGGIASVEIALCLHQRWEKKFAGANRFEIKLFTSSDRIGGGLNASAINQLERILASRRIEIYSSQSVVGVSDQAITTADGESHAADVVVWATGAAPVPWLADLALEHDEKGFVATHKTLQSVSKANIFAVGDSGTIIESPSPKAGVFAVRQSPILWHNLQVFFEGGKMRDFEPQKDFLKILNTGDDKALLAYRNWSAHAKWCWYLKKWIDKRFIEQYQNPSE